MVIIAIWSCDDEVNITFEDTLIETADQAKISIDIPKAVGTNSVADNINKVIETYVANQTNMANEEFEEKSIDQAIKKFNMEYETFSNDFPEGLQQWEALIDGEVTYQTPEIISITINSYIDTGGAHGNTTVGFLNFNAQTGGELTNSDLISDREKFSNIVERYFENETAPKNENGEIQDFFFGKDFQLPESIGFSDEGVIILYNTYEIASYAQGITEFVIPYSEVESVLTMN